MARANWGVHVGAMCVVVSAVLAVSWTHPSREGMRGLNDGILVFLALVLGLGYAALSSLAVLVLRKTPRAAWFVHGGSVLMSVATLGAMWVVG